MALGSRGKYARGFRENPLLARSAANMAANDWVIRMRGWRTPRAGGLENRPPADTRKLRSPFDAALEEKQASLIRARARARVEYFTAGIIIRPGCENNFPDSHCEPGVPAYSAVRVAEEPSIFAREMLFPVDAVAACRTCGCYY